MNNIKNLSDQLQRAYSGEAWHGPSLREILTDVTSPIANARPIAGAHSIWELAMHIGAWVSTVRRRLAGQPVELSAQEDWPAIDGGSETAWQQTLTALDDEHNKLREAISALPEESLRLTVAGERYSVFFMLQGVIQHNLYHAGQIALLKKALSAS
jgi:uncharacterized damage-inducible protein DinB